jgi:uncharacterized membrane protein YcjF (UPF0283 family)
MENEHNDTEKSDNITDKSTTKPVVNKTDVLHTIVKISLIVFILSICLLAIFWIIDIWGGFSSDSNDIFSKLEGTLGVLTGVSLLLSIVARAFATKKK